MAHVFIINWMTGRMCYSSDEEPLQVTATTVRLAWSSRHQGREILIVFLFVNPLILDLSGDTIILAFASHCKILVVTVSAQLMT